MGKLQAITSEHTLDIINVARKRIDEYFPAQVKAQQTPFSPSIGHATTTAASPHERIAQPTQAEEQPSGPRPHTSAKTSKLKQARKNTEHAQQQAERHDSPIIPTTRSRKSPQVEVSVPLHSLEEFETTQTIPPLSRKSAVESQAVDDHVDDSVEEEPTRDERTKRSTPKKDMMSREMRRLLIDANPSLGGQENVPAKRPRTKPKLFNGSKPTREPQQSHSQYNRFAKRKLSFDLPKTPPDHIVDEFLLIMATYAEEWDTVRILQSTAQESIQRDIRGETLLQREQRKQREIAMMEAWPLTDGEISATEDRGHQESVGKHTVLDEDMEMDGGAYSATLDNGEAEGEVENGRAKRWKGKGKAL